MPSRSRPLTLIEDVNQKKSQHEDKNSKWREAGINVVRCKLPYGDYQLPAERNVDTKRDIYELAQNLVNDHERFRNAAIKARECGTHLIILVQNEDGVRSLADLAEWMEPNRHYLNRKRRHPNARRYDGHQLAEACKKMSGRYGIEFDFCSNDEAWERVFQHLGVIL